jgi:hypothetical protein
LNSSNSVRHNLIILQEVILSMLFLYIKRN